jgi:hypothetical protein
MDIIDTGAPSGCDPALCNHAAQPIAMPTTALNLTDRANAASCGCKGRARFSGRVTVSSDPRIVRRGERVLGVERRKDDVHDHIFIGFKTVRQRLCVSAVCNRGTVTFYVLEHAHDTPPGEEVTECVAPTRAPVTRNNVTRPELASSDISPIAPPACDEHEQMPRVRGVCGGECRAESCYDCALADSRRECHERLVNHSGTSAVC